MLSYPAQLPASDYSKICRLGVRIRFWSVVFNSHMFNVTEVQIFKGHFRFTIFTML
jgi:hypothetical protein